MKNVTPGKDPLADVALLVASQIDGWLEETAHQGRQPMERTIFKEMAYNLRNAVFETHAPKVIEGLEQLRLMHGNR